MNYVAAVGMRVWVRDLINENFRWGVRWGVDYKIIFPNRCTILDGPCSLGSWSVGSREGPYSLRPMEYIPYGLINHITMGNNHSYWSGLMKAALRDSEM